MGLDLEACQGLAAAQWERSTDCPGWTVKDQLAHLASIERMLLGDEAPPPLDEKPGHVRNAIGEINEAWIDHYRTAGGPDVLAGFVRCHQPEDRRPALVPTGAVRPGRMEPRG